MNSMTAQPSTYRSVDYLPSREAGLSRSSHSAVVGYLLWAFGFFGAHRFYYGKPISGLIYVCTLGLFFVGWIIDLILIPGMAERAQTRHVAGRYDHNVAWLMHSLFLLGILGLHRFYLGKWITGVLWLLTGGLFGIGFIYDWFTLNAQVDEANRRDWDAR